MTMSRPQEEPASPAFRGPEPLRMPQPEMQDLPGDGVFEEEMRQFGNWLAQDPVLLASEEVLNANPLHEVIPIDWAEIARALRAIWLHQLSRPETAITNAADFNLKLFKSTFDIWMEAAQRLCGVAPPSADATAGEPASGRDKRFSAPNGKITRSIAP